MFSPHCLFSIRLILRLFITLIISVIIFIIKVLIKLSFVLSCFFFLAEFGMKEDLRKVEAGGVTSQDLYVKR